MDTRHITLFPQPSFFMREDKPFPQLHEQIYRPDCYFRRKLLTLRKNMKVIIIGGVAGGATTAARIRRVDESAEIILLEKGKYISYANCGLPYYIGGVIEDRDKLFVQTPEVFSTRFRVDVRMENEVIFIDRKRKTITVRQSSEDTYEESYDKLLISTGASPVRPPLQGIDLNGIFTLRNVADTDRIKEYNSLACLP